MQDKEFESDVPVQNLPGLVFQEPASIESARVQEYRLKYVDLLKKERSEHEAVLER